MSRINDSRSRRRRNLESTVLIWLTSKPNEVQLNRLRNIIDYVKVFDNVDACNDYIEQAEDNDKIYVVTDTPYTSNEAQVYVYENNENFNEVTDAIVSDDNTQINSFSINIFKRSTHSQLNSEFLWFQRVLSILSDNDDRGKAKKKGNRKKEEKIQLFETTYQSENALQ